MQQLTTTSIQTFKYINTLNIMKYILSNKIKHTSRLTYYVHKLQCLK